MLKASLQPSLLEPLFPPRVSWMPGSLHPQEQYLGARGSGQEGGSVHPRLCSDLVTHLGLHLPGPSEETSWDASGSSSPGREERGASGCCSQAHGPAPRGTDSLAFHVWSM
ncbi:unnamed protein product [Rangifer tarandus platyrhynchus]|uniref:Uncharacterized protein n=1 Tax=Rangifer tarandus platyrhynchus TaxID=3082113 RepID=A0ABN8Z1M6_RANTA|nr:unnamed protein product [Rangifer tarandus platyrhynchus]